MTISCSLGPQLKDEALNIDVKLLLNTEILKSVRNTPTLLLFFGGGDCNINGASPSVNQ